MVGKYITGLCGSQVKNECELSWGEGGAVSTHVHISCGGEKKSL